MIKWEIFQKIKMSKNKKKSIPIRTKLIFFRRNFFSGFFSLMLGFLTTVSTYAGYTFWTNKNIEEITTSEVKTAKVIRGNLSVTVKAMGQAELVNEQQLRFNKSGTIEVVNFSDGDRVKKDEIIAKLDKEEVLNDIKQAEITLENARLDLQDLLNNDISTEKLKIENSIRDNERKVEIAQNELNILKNEKENALDKIDKDIEEKKLSLNDLKEDDMTDQKKNEREIEQIEKEIAEKKKSIEEARADLENTKKIEEESVSDTIQNIASEKKSVLLGIKDAIIETDDILNDLNTILGKDNPTNVNDSFETNLGALSSQSLRDAEKGYSLLKGKKATQEKGLEELENQENPSLEALINFLTTTEEMANQAIKASDLTYTLLEKTITSSSLSQANLNSLKSTVSSCRSSAKSILNSINTSKNSLESLEKEEITRLKSENTITNKENTLRSEILALEKLEKSLEDAKTSSQSNTNDKKLSLNTTQNEIANLEVERTQSSSDYDLKIKNKENEIVALEESLATSREEIKDLEKGETAERIKSAQNNITQKQLALEKVRKTQENYELKAPFDGLIRKIDFQVGDNLVSDETKYVYLENPDLLKISVLLDQVDIIKVFANQKVNITFDALPHKVFEGSIEEIDSTPVEQSGVVSYEASITVEKGENRIFSGMTATVEIITAEKENVLLVPNLAIKSRGDRKFVEKKIGENIERAKIKIGITDGKNTEVISGLEEGDEIVMVDYSTLKKGTSAQNNQDAMRRMMRGGGGGGRR